MGLEAGDVVVTEGTQKIRPGSQLDVVQQQANGDVGRGPGG